MSHEEEWGSLGFQRAYSVFLHEFTKFIIACSNVSHTFVYLISFLIDKLSWEVTQSIIIQRNVYITQINIIENYGLGVYLLHIQLRKLTGIIK